MVPYSDDIRGLIPGKIQYKWQVITYSTAQKNDKCYVLLESEWFNEESDFMLDYEENMKKGYDIINCFCTKEVIVKRNILT